jgi:purine-binding chemotaxis protein CheW
MTLTTAPAGSSGRNGATATDGGRYLTFTLRGELYALDILQITEIIEYRPLTVVPMMPPHVRGVLNLRGQVLPVIDLAARFGQPTTTVARRTGIIVLQAQHHTDRPGQAIGIMVDSVNKVVHLPAADIEPPPTFGAGIHTDFITGMARHHGEFLVVLNPATVLTHHDLARLGHQLGDTQLSDSLPGEG